MKTASQPSSAAPKNGGPKTGASKKGAKKASGKKPNPKTRRGKAKSPPAREPRGEGPTVMHPHAAGIDLGSREHWVCVPAESAPEPVRSFGTTTPELKKLVAWLQSCAVDTVAMEATGVYWEPLYDLLETAGLKPVLVDPYAVKNVPGRKSDSKDCQWLQQLHRCGLLRAAFIPVAAVRVLRSLQRQRQNLIEASTVHIGHMQKALLQMNLALHHVLSDITGESALRILDAILGGERDPQKLATLVNRKVQATPAALAASLSGHYLPEQLFILEQELQSYRHVQKQIEACETKLLAELAALPTPAPPDPAPASAAAAQSTEVAPATRTPAEPAASAPGAQPSPPRPRRRSRTPTEKSVAEHLYRILSVDLTLLPGLGVLAVLSLITEIGWDMSPWRNAKAFVSWLGLCPNHRISGGRILSARTRKVASRAANILRLAAMAAGKTQTPLGAFYQRKKRQFGPAKANVATARKLACLIYELLRRREAYREQPLHVYELQQRDHHLSYLRKKAAALGFELHAKAA